MIRILLSDILAVIAILLALTQYAHGATRLGLHVTQEELNCWRQRAGLDAQGTNGITCPVRYKTDGDVSTNSPGDWTRILANANSFLSNQTENLWTGYTGAGCMTMESINLRQLGRKLRDAAFVYLVTGTTSYRDGVRTQLLNQAALAGLNFADTTKFNTNSGCLQGLHGPVFEMSAYMTRLLYAYDYLNAKSSTAFTDTQKTTLNSWFLNAGMFLSKRTNEFALERWPNRESDNYTPPSAKNIWGLDEGTIYFGGQTTSGWHLFLWANIGLTNMNFAGSVGIAINNTTLKNRAKRFFKEFIKYSVYANGDTIELGRWLADEPYHGYVYVFAGLGMATTIADHFGRAGDLSLYDYSTSEGYDPGTNSASGPNTTAGGPKTLSLAIGKALQFTTISTVKYFTTNCNGNINYRVDSEFPTIPSSACVGTSPLANSFRIIHDIWTYPANLYYNVSERKSIYLRTASGTVPYPANPHHGGYEPWSGLWGVYPGIMFQFAQNEGVVNPFGGATPTPPTATLTANPTSTDSTSQLTWSSTDTTSCTASCNNADCDGWTGSKATSGGPETVSPAATTDYSLSCTGPGGTAVDTETVALTPPTQGFRVAKFQFRSWTGTEASPSWSGTTYSTDNAANTVTMIEDGCIGLQMRIECDAGTQCPTGPLPLRYRKNGGGSYTALTDTCGDLCYDDAPDVGHNEVTTNRLTGSGIFEAGHVIESASVLLNEALAAGEANNMLYMICADTLVPGDYVELRPYQANGEAFTNYITPRLDIGVPAATRGGGSLSVGGGTTK